MMHENTQSRQRAGMGHYYVIHLIYRAGLRENTRSVPIGGIRAQKDHKYIDSDYERSNRPHDTSDIDVDTLIALRGSNLQNGQKKGTRGAVLAPTWQPAPGPKGAPVGTKLKRAPGKGTSPPKRAGQGTGVKKAKGNHGGDLATHPLSARGRTFRALTAPPPGGPELPS